MKVRQIVCSIYLFYIVVGSNIQHVVVSTVSDGKLSC